MTVHKLTPGESAGKLGSELTHVLTGHTRDVLCADTRADLVVSGGLDTTVLVYRLGPENLFKVVHKLTGHTLKVYTRYYSIYILSFNLHRCEV